jgi:hypothetical protein
VQQKAYYCAESYWKNPASTGEQGLLLVMHTIKVTIFNHES